jgi:ribosomal protein L37AE/L43A
VASCRVNETSFDESIYQGGIMEKIRACPICPMCGSKKFERLKAKDTIVRCAKCGNELSI